MRNWRAQGRSAGRCGSAAAALGENPSGFALLSHLPFQGRLWGALTDARASPERGGGTAGDGGAIPLVRLPCVSIGMLCVRFTPALRFCWNALRSVHACCLTHSAKQDGLRNVAFLFRRGRTADLYVLKRLYGHPTWRVHFRSVRFLTAARDTGERGRRHGVSTFLREPIGFDMFSAGNTLGAARPPNLRQRVKSGSRTAASLDSLHWIRGVGALCPAGKVRKTMRLP